MSCKCYLLTSLGLVLFVTLIAITTAQFAFVPITDAQGVPDFDIFTTPDLNDLNLCPEYFPDDTFNLDLNDEVLKKLCANFRISLNDDLLEEEEKTTKCARLKARDNINCQKLTIEQPDKSKMIGCVKPNNLNKTTCKVPTAVCLNKCKPRSRLKTENIQLILPPTEVKVPKGMEYLKCEIPIENLSTDVGILGDLDCWVCDDSCRIKKVQDSGLYCCLL